MATWKALTLLANYPIMLGTSIQLIRHLEHQNPSNISEDIGRVMMVQQLWRSQIGAGGVRLVEYSCLRAQDMIQGLDALYGSATMKPYQ